MALKTTYGACIFLGPEPLIVHIPGSCPRMQIRVGAVALPGSSVFCIALYSPPSLVFPVKFSKNDVEALEEIMEHYMEGNAERNSVIAAPTTGIASVRVARSIRRPHLSLILPHIERLIALDREKRHDDGPLVSQKGGRFIKGMEKDLQMHNKEEESSPLHLLSEASRDKSSPAATA
ncbi:hypothetical protein B0H13DRAFT_1904470 [Mycena leptocephala]|nr:hypothetical protein B0H13DRAFT_1904470 [Mycena leptocephala]